MDTLHLLESTLLCSLAFAGSSHFLLKTSCEAADDVLANEVEASLAAEVIGAATSSSVNFAFLLQSSDLRTKGGFPVGRLGDAGASTAGDGQAGSYRGEVALDGQLLRADADLAPF